MEARISEFLLEMHSQVELAGVELRDRVEEVSQARRELIDCTEHQLLLLYDRTERTERIKSVITAFAESAYKVINVQLPQRNDSILPQLNEAGTQTEQTDHPLSAKRAISVGDEEEKTAKLCETENITDNTPRYRQQQTKRPKSHHDFPGLTAASVSVED